MSFPHTLELFSLKNATCDPIKIWWWGSRLVLKLLIIVDNRMHEKTALCNSWSPGGELLSVNFPFLLQHENHDAESRGMSGSWVWHQLCWATETFCTITSFGRRTTALSPNWLPHPRVRSLNYFPVLFLINLERAFVHRNLGTNVHQHFYTSLQLPRSAGRELFQSGKFPGKCAGISQGGRWGTRGCSKGTRARLGTSLNPKEFHENV